MPRRPPSSSASGARPARLAPLDARQRLQRGGEGRVLLLERRRGLDQRFVPGRGVVDGTVRDGGLLGLDLRQQPVPQPRRGDAVVPVVVLDVGADRPRDLGVPGLHRGDVPVVLGDAVRRRRDAVLRPVLRPHVERLQLLDGVARHTGPQGGADRGVEVHEQARAEPVVQLALAHPVAHREPLERRDLVRGVVVDPHPRVGRAPRLHERHELLERRPLLAAGVRPQPREPEVPEGRAGGVPARGLHPAPQVLQPLHLTGGGGPQRVALEVEEHVPLAGLGQPEDRHRVHDGERRGPVRPPGRQLGRGLVPQRPPRALRHPRGGRGGVRQLLDGLDPGLPQPRALQAGGPGGEQHVPVRLHRLRTGLARPADRQGVVAPAGGLPGGHVCPQQALQPGPLVPIHRDDLGEVRPVPGAVAQPEAAVPGARHAHPVQQVRVGGDLQQRRHAGVPGQLGVHHLVGALGVLLVPAQHQEVGEAAERAVVQHRLEDDGGPPRQRLRGPLARGRHGGRGVRARPLQPHHLLLAMLGHQAPEGALLVGVAEPGHALQHGVLDGEPRRPPQRRIHLHAQPPVGARGGGRDVRGAEGDERAVGRDADHGHTLGVTPDTARPHRSAPAVVIRCHEVGGAPVRLDAGHIDGVT